MFETILNPIFSPLLKIPAVIAIAIVSLLVSFIITIVYKYMTDQTLMKDLKTRQKDLQKKMKTLRSDPAKLMKAQKEAMEVNMKYMSQSLKPTLVTFIPIIIIFAWLNANIAYEPILPGQEFTATLTFNKDFAGNVTLEAPENIKVIGSSNKEITNGTASFKMKGKEGEYGLPFTYDNKKYTTTVIITKDTRYAPVQKTFSKEPLKMITLSNQKLIAINLLGRDEGGFFSGRIGWLGTYIIFSIIASFGLRKLMKIY
jgi:uncharacterized membrane protein (DUF106 family)